MCALICSDKLKKFVFDKDGAGHGVGMCGVAVMIKVWLWFLCEAGMNEVPRVVLWRRSCKPHWLHSIKATFSFDGS